MDRSSVTQAVAATMQCCGPPGAGTYENRDGEHTPHPHDHRRYCVADKCLAWRWVHKDWSTIGNANSTGYCGLGGPVDVAS